MSSLRPVHLLALAAGVLLAVMGAASACPGEASVCRIDGGDYLIALPEADRAGKKPPVMIHLHGFGGTAPGVLQSDFTKIFSAQGFAVIAPQGLVSPIEHHTDWSVRDGEPHPRDDVAFVQAVLRDAVKRFGLDEDKVLLTGFSRGASMVWDIACLAPATASAYAPVSGGFWDPFPTGCAGPVRLLHTHGFSDKTVPLEGRPIQGRMRQADIFQGLELWRNVDGCGARAGMQNVNGPIWQKVWTDCQAGTLEFALHSGTHGVPDGWAEMAIAWFEGLPPAPVGKRG